MSSDKIVNKIVRIGMAVQPDCRICIRIPLNGRSYQFINPGGIGFVIINCDVEELFSGEDCYSVLKACDGLVEAAR